MKKSKKKKKKMKHCDESLKKKEGSEEEKEIAPKLKRRVIIESESDKEDVSWRPVLLLSEKW